MRPQRVHLAGVVEDDVQRCMVCGEVLFDENESKVGPNTRVVEQFREPGREHSIETLRPQDSLPLGFTYCQPKEEAGTP